MAIRTVNVQVGLPDGPPLVTAKRRKVLELLVGQVARAVGTMPAHTLDQVAAQLAQPESHTAADAALVANFTGGKTFGLDESKAIQAAALVASYDRRRQVLADALSTNEVSRLLGVSRQTPHDRASAGTLLAVQENGALRFPAWQFDPNGENGVLKGLPQVLRALDVSPLGKAVWFTRPCGDLGGRRPVDVLTKGAVHEVLSAASFVGAR